MAKLIDLDDKEIKRKNLVRTLILLFLLCSVVFGCFVHQKREEELYKDETPMAGVHVKGAVVNSGYYEVPFGTRVRDLESVVGGFLDCADLDGVNLAGYVNDGSEIYVPYKGTLETGAINLNTATVEQLQTVSGIGEKSSKAIVDYRESHGSFHSVIELKEILSEKTYAAVCEKFYVE